jgi:hypothetical protein
MRASVAGEGEYQGEHEDESNDGLIAIPRRVSGADYRPD